MSTSQGFFESDEAYRDRISTEADERSVSELTGSAPSQRFFESNDTYKDRIRSEAHSARIEAEAGEPPSRGIFEDENRFRERISREADEATIGLQTGARPSQGFFESTEDYAVRIRESANATIVESMTGQKPSQGWFEDDHTYRARLAHEARLAMSSSETQPISGESNSSTNNEHPKPTGVAAGFVIVIGLLIGMFVFGRTQIDPSSKPAKSHPERLTAVVGGPPDNILTKLESLASRDGDAVLFQVHERTYTWPATRLHSAIVRVLSRQGDTIDLDSELDSTITTEVTRHGLPGFPHFNRHYIVIDVVDDSRSTMQLKLCTYYGEHDKRRLGYWRLVPEESSAVKHRRATAFLDAVDRELNGDPYSNKHHTGGWYE